MQAARLIGRRVRVKGRAEIGRVIHQWGQKFAAAPDEVWGVIVRFDRTREIGWFQVSELELID